MTDAVQVPLREAWITPPTPPPTDEERAAIEGCVRDYFEGWFEGDPIRMERALHPELAKRCYGQTVDRAPVLLTDTAEGMIEATREGRGRIRAGGRPIEIEIIDAGRGIASVVVRSEHYHEYLHLVQAPEGWRIVNALWRWADGHGPRA
jgi:putative lumazine-binding protein